MSFQDPRGRWYFEERPGFQVRRVCRCGRAFFVHSERSLRRHCGQHCNNNAYMERKFAALVRELEAGEEPLSPTGPDCCPECGSPADSPNTDCPVCSIPADEDPAVL